MNLCPPETHLEPGLSPLAATIRRLRRLGMAAGLCLSASTHAQQTPSETGSAAYLREIGEAQAELSAGRTDDAGKLLDATDRSLRSFEFDYLLARVQAAPPGTGLAQDLIRKVDTPAVETRSGVLNEISRQLVFICRDGGLRIHELASPGTPERRVAHPKGSAVYSGVFSRDGTVFFSGHENGDVLVWDAAKWEIRQTISLNLGTPVGELAAAPDGSAFVAEGEKELELWSLAGDKPKKVAGVGERYNFGEGLAFGPQGDLIATGGMFDIDLMDAKTGRKVRSMRHVSYTMGLAFSADGKRIASAPRGDMNKFLAVFDVSQDKPLFNVGPFSSPIVGLAFAPDGKRIAVTTCEKAVKFFDAGTGEVMLSLPRPECGSDPAFSRDGRLLGWSEHDGYHFIDLGTSREKKERN